MIRMLIVVVMTTMMLMLMTIMTTMVVMIIIKGATSRITHLEKLASFFKFVIRNPS